MALLYSVFGFLPDVSCCDPESFDMLSTLPYEMAIAILRLLSGKDLLNAACASSRWLQLCKSDKRLRTVIRRHLRSLARRRIRAVINDDIVRRRDRPGTRNPSMRAIDGVQEQFSFRRAQVAGDNGTVHRVRGSVSRPQRYSPYLRPTRSEPLSGRGRVIRT